MEYDDQDLDDYLPDEPNPNNSDGLSDNELRARTEWEALHDPAYWY